MAASVFGVHPGDITHEKESRVVFPSLLLRSIPWTSIISYAYFGGCVLAAAVSGHRLLPAVFFVQS